MPLPEKGYYSLEEIAHRWGKPIRDICDYALEGVIELHAWLGKVEVELYHWEELTADDAFRVPVGKRRFNGYVTVLPVDLREVFRAGASDVGTYRMIDGKCDSPLYLDIVNRPHPYIIELRDLVMSKTERDKIETAYNLVFDDPEPPPLSSPPRKPERCSFAGRPTVMHLIIGQLEKRAREGKLCANATYEAEALREWALAHIKDMQVPQRKSIYNRILKRYRELTERELTPA